MRFSAQHQPCGSVRSDGCLSKYCQVIGLLADTEIDFLFFSLLILLFFHWKNLKKKKKKQVVTVKLAFVTSVLTCFFMIVTEGSSEEETSAISFTLVPAYCMSTLLLSPHLWTPWRIWLFTPENNNSNKNCSFMQWWVFWQANKAETKDDCSEHCDDGLKKLCSVDSIIHIL